MTFDRRTIYAFALLAIAGGARILLQIAAMPPYAGLDEIYHVARVNFVQQENRNPTATEPSVAAYIHESLALEKRVQPDFVEAAPRWREMVRGGYRLPPSHAIPPYERTTYLTENYQAQQASLHYWIAAAVVNLASDGSRLSELRSLRWLSAILALFTVLATGFIGYTLAGLRGVAASGLLFLFPTWQTLVVRASNDALAVAALSVALALSIRGTRRLMIVEALTWAVALAAKLFTWPLVIVLPVIWRHQKATSARIAIVGLACLASMIGTSVELRARTGVAVGLGAFNDPAVENVEEKPIAYGEMVKITIASAIWMSGQHDNALTVKGMAIYVLPPLIGFVLLFLLAPPSGDQRTWALVTAAALAAFAVAQAFHAAAHIRNARLLGESLPAAGKEGWYWFALAPLVVGVLLAPLFERVRCGFLVIAVGWLLAWDVLITEGALLRDYAGLTGPETPSTLFRWGPAPVVSPDIGSALSGLAAGPLTEWIVLLRIISIAAIVSLLVVGCRHREVEAPAEPLHG